MNKSKLKALKVMTTAAVTSLILSSFTVYAETNDASTDSQSIEDKVEQGRSLFFDLDKVETGNDNLYNYGFNS